jgi:hypothetical protein
LGAGAASAIRCAIDDPSAQIASIAPTSSPRASSSFGAASCAIVRHSGGASR